MSEDAAVRDRKEWSRRPGLPRREVPVCLVLLPTLLILLTACHPLCDYEAALVIMDIAAGPAPTRLKSTTPPPRLTAVTIPAAGTAISGDLYLPPQKPLAGLLLLPGAAEKGKDDPRLRAFANSLCRARFAVLVPDLEGFRSLQVRSRDITEIADIFAWLATRPDLAPQGRAGIFSFSYASGPAILATLQPRIKGKVGFLMAVGGYYDAKAVLTFFTTGYFKEGGTWRYMEPNSYGKWVFILSNVELLSDPGDRERFRQAAQRKMNDLKAPIDDLAAGLTPEGRRVYDFVDNKEPARVIPLMERLPDQVRREIRALDLAEHDLGSLTTHFILVHGYDDDIIPYTESIALEKGLPPGLARLYLVHGLKHVNLKVGIIDKFKLWRAISALLRERDGAGSPPGV